MVRLDDSWSHLHGNNSLEQSEVDQWLEYCLNEIEPSYQDLTHMKSICKVRLTPYSIPGAHLGGEGDTSPALKKKSVFESPENS